MEHGPRRTVHDGRLHCPVCGSILGARLLKVEDEDQGVAELPVLFDCPNGDFYTAVTHRDIVTVLTAEVRERLGF